MNANTHLIIVAFQDAQVELMGLINIQADILGKDISNDLVSYSFFKIKDFDVKILLWCLKLTDVKCNWKSQKELNTWF